MSGREDLYKGLIVPDASLLTVKQRQIDEKIDINTRMLETCLGKLENLLVELPTDTGSTNPYLDLEDRLENISNFHSIEKTACYDLDLEDLQAFFTTVTEYLTQNPGCEGSILSMLIELCAHNGVTLPWKMPSSSSHQGASMMSLNVVNDEDEQMCEALWEELRRALEDHVVACLYQLPVTDESVVMRQSRSGYMDQLHLLISTRQLCQQYRQLRICSLNQLINDQLSSEGSSPTFPQIVNAFERITHNVITMIDGDFHVLISGVFRKVSTAFEIISSIYFEKLTDELESVLDDLANDIYGQVDARITSRRQSDFALADKLKEKIIKTKPGASKLERMTSMGATSVEVDVHLDADIAQSMVRLAKALNLVDQHVYNLYLMSYTGLRGTSARSPLSSGEIRGVLKSTSVTDISILSESLTSDNSDLNSLLNSGRLHGHVTDKAPQVVDRPVHHDKPVFLWQESLKRFVSDLSTIVESHIGSAANTCVTALSGGKSLETIKLCVNKRGTKLEYPVTAWKAVADFVTALESMFPLAQAGHTLTPVRQAFVSATVSWSKHLMETFHKVIDEKLQVTEGTQVLLTCLSSIALLRNTLYHCDTILHKDASEKQNTFVLVYHQTCQAVDSLSQQYVSLEVDMINNSLLHDVESFDWSDHQEFFEAERCSFPVQAWSYHLQKLRLELWSTCPPSNAVAIFSDIVRQTLDGITLRYLNEYPSYRRTEQYRMDIATVLHTVYELMFYMCSNSTQLLDIQSIAFEQPYLTIHSCCCKLVSALAIYTSPLEELYKVYKKGYQKKSRRRRQSPNSVEDEPGHYSHWLAWIQPQIIPKSVCRLSDMQTTTALYIQIKLLLSQPEPVWSLLIQILVMKEFTLPIMLLTQPNLTIHSDTSAPNHPESTIKSSHVYSNPAYQPHMEETTTNSAPENLTSGCDLTFCDGDCRLAPSDVRTLFEPFLMTLVNCNKPLALYNVILPVINRAEQWDLLNAENFWHNMNTQAPGWLSVITDIISNSLSSVIKSTIILVHQSLHEEQNSKLDVRGFIGSLPCGCDFEEIADGHEGRWQRTIIESILSGLTETVSKLPISVCTLLDKLGDDLLGQLNLTNRSINQSITNNLILQVVGLTVSQCLCDEEYLTKCNQGKLSKEVLTKLSEQANCVYAALCNGADMSIPELSKEHMSYLTESHHWLEVQRRDILSNICQRESMWPDLDVDGGTAESFAEFATTGIASDILETQKGELYLRQIYNLLANNEDWLYFSLDVQGSLPKSDHGRVEEFIPDTCHLGDTRTKAMSNPLRMHKRIGNTVIDFEAMRAHTESCGTLLHSDLGISDVALAAMLQHRHDFQEGAPLEPAERKHVESLRSKFNISSTQ